jgi:hypothetical protein
VPQKKKERREKERNEEWKYCNTPKEQTLVSSRENNFCSPYQLHKVEGTFLMGLEFEFKTFHLLEPNFRLKDTFFSLHKYSSLAYHEG